MQHFLGMADQRKHGIDRFDHHPIVPGAARTELEVGWITRAGMKPQVFQEQHPILEDLDQRVKQRIGDVGRRVQPTNDAAPAVNPQTQFVAHDPAMGRETLAADLARATPLANRMAQFDTVTVDHPQQRRLGQEPQGPPAVDEQRPKKPGPLG